MHGTWSYNFQPFDQVWGPRPQLIGKHIYLTTTDVDFVSCIKLLLIMVVVWWALIIIMVVVVVCLFVWMDRIWERGDRMLWDGLFWDGLFVRQVEPANVWGCRQIRVLGLISPHGEDEPNRGRSYGEDFLGPIHMTITKSIERVYFVTTVPIRYIR